MILVRLLLGNVINIFFCDVTRASSSFQFQIISTVKNIKQLVIQHDVESCWITSHARFCRKMTFFFFYCSIHLQKLNSRTSRISIGSSPPWGSSSLPSLRGADGDTAPRKWTKPGAMWTVWWLLLFHLLAEALCIILK